VRVIVINVYGHIFHTSAACGVVQRHKHAVRFMDKREASLYFGMVPCDRCPQHAQIGA
jgi:hypothetical protein